MQSEGCLVTLSPSARPIKLSKQHLRDASNRSSVGGSSPRGHRPSVRQAGGFTAEAEREREREREGGDPTAREVGLETSRLDPPPHKGGARTTFGILAQSEEIGKNCR